MKLDLSKIKEQAEEQEKVKLNAKQNEQNVQKLKEAHKKSVIKFFNDSFNGEKVINGNGGSNYRVDFGEFSIQLQFILGELEGQTIKSSDKVNFQLSKYLDQKIVSSAKFVDQTNYDSPNLVPENYLYMVTYNRSTTMSDFGQLQQILQNIVNE